MKVEQSKRATSLEIMTYHDLLLGLKEPGELAFTINELKTEFHRRVKNKLYQRCVGFAQKNRVDESTAKEIFQKTMIKALEKISAFELEACWTEEQCGQKIAVWLNRIAYHLFMDFFNERSKFDVLADDYYEIQDDNGRPDDFEYERNDTTPVKLQDAMDSLNDRERLIINLCLQYDCLDNKNHLPDNIIADICRTLNVKKGNIRVIKLRALQKMHNILSQT